MKRHILKLLANIIGIYIMISVVSLIESNGTVDILIFAFVLWLINLLLRPLLLLVTLPINMLTLGVFSLIINTWLIMLTDAIIKGVYIPGFGISFILAVLILVLNLVFKGLVKQSKS